MAPSQIPKEALASSTAASIGDNSSSTSTAGSRLLSSSSQPPSSAPSPKSPSSKNISQQQKGTDDSRKGNGSMGGGGGGGGGGVDKEVPMSDSPRDSEEEMYYRSHHDDNSHEDEDHHEHGEMGEIESQQQQQQRQRQQRPKQIRRSGKSSNDNYNGKPVPEVKYAKAGILTPSNVDMDRGSNGNNGDLGQILPGETLYLSQNPGNPGASGQYQMHPGYTTNGHNGNGNYNGDGNGNGYMPHPNGAASPQPNPYSNGNGVPHYPYMHYPPNQQPGPGGVPPYPISFYDPHRPQYVMSSNSTSDDGLNVRGEEVGIVLVVLLLWVGAIILFFNRWGKIRMLEPYQPKFCEAHRPSCPMADVTAISNIPVCRERTFSKYNLSTEMLTANGSPHFVKCNYHGIPSADPAPGFSGLTSTTVLPGGLTIPGGGFPGGGSTGMLNNHRNSIMMMNHHQYQHHHHLRPRQNSVFVTSPSSQVSFYGSDSALKSSSRKTKSAVDLPTLVLTGEFMDNVRRNSKNSITQL